jgi:serine/threonine protein kinase
MYKVDVYAFGIILWELASGKRPYEFIPSPIAILFRVCIVLLCVSSNDPSESVAPRCFCYVQVKIEGLRPVVPDECPPLLADLMVLRAMRKTNKFLLVVC